MALSRKKQKSVAGLVTGSLLATWITLIINNDGVSSAQIELNDGGVWVTNQEKQLVGHLNYPAFSLDSSVRTKASRFEISQNADSVLFQNQDAGELSTVNPAFVSFENEAALEGASFLTLGGQTVAAYDPIEGDVWATDFESASSVGAEHNLLSIDVPMGSVAVTETGTVVAASAESRVWHNGETSIGFPSGIADGEDIQISTFGEQSVILGLESKTLHFEDGHSVSLSGDQLKLQLPGPESPHVIVANTAGLFTVEADKDGKVTFRDQAGEDADPTLAPSSSTLMAGNPARPAIHSSCSYSAWSGSGRFIRDCGGEDQDLALENEGLKYAEAPQFRINRDVIVLNDVNSGNVWLPDEDLMLIDNWELITTDDPDSEEESEEQSNSLSDEPEDPEMQEENIDPVAEDDTFGARAGATAILPVLNNDSDENGDILTVALENSPAGADVVPIRGGTAFQVSLPSDATETVTFRYRAMDGRGGEDTADVTVNIHPDSVNSPPTQVHQTRAKLAQKGRVTIESLGDWIDPDGDPIYLEGVQETEGLETRYLPNGTIEIIDTNVTTGLTQIPIFVSDGRQAGEGLINLEVTDVSGQPPIPNADHVVVTVGETVEVAPLVNDTDPNGDSLRLVSIGTPPDGLIARASTALGTVTVSASKVGTYYLTYSVSDGTAASTGRIRIDAISPEQNNLPVAESDMGVLPEGGSVLVDVLNNDYDPQGGVLTVTGVEVPEGSLLHVAPVAHEMVRVTAPRGLTEPASFTYTIANSTGSATGSVLIIPAPALDGTEPPELSPDRLVVREGDVGSVNVLANDRSPSQLDMTVSPVLEHTIAATAGDAFVSDNLVRFRAGNEPGEYQVIYTVTDTRGNVSSSTVTVVVVAKTEDQNLAPTPRDLTARVVAGRSVSIPVPLLGIDADGDSVSLLPDHTSPSLGTVEMNNDGTFTYTAHETSTGTDTFTYRVRDALGGIGEARVRIGIAPAPQINQPPVAQNDIIVVRPGARVEAPVLANDVDPDGDELSLVAGATATQTTELLVEEEDNLVIVTAPQKPGVYSVSYQVEDGRGGSARGLLTVDVKTNSPLLAPVAIDDSVTIDGAPTSVTVNVLDNDYDPDGDRASLIVTSDDPGVTVNEDKTLTIQTTAQRQLVLYTITDGDELSASAIVVVPPVLTKTDEDMAKEAPRLIDGALVTVNAGETVDIPLNDYITPRVSMTNPDLVQASVGWNGDRLVKSNEQLSFTSKPDFAGRTSVTLEVVTDDGVTGTVTIPIEVIGMENQAPNFLGNVVEVGAGEEPLILNLRAMAEDPDGDALSFTLTGSPAGLNVSLSGEQLSVGAPLDHPVGGAGQITADVSDGQNTITGQISVTVLASSEPLVQLSPIHEEVKLGETVTVDIAASAMNPFPDPLRLRSQPQVVGGSASVSTSGTNISIRPTDQGEVTVGYIVQDATGQQGRDVQGIITVSVKADPDPPRNVSARSDGQTVTVSWTQGALNGGRLTGFTVVDLTQGDSVECGVATSCQLTGRTWGDHNFHVIQHTDVGDSLPSVTASVNVDQVPGAPTGVVATAGDRQMDLRWNYASPAVGSPITKTQVCLVQTGACVNVTPSATTYTFSGLANGTTYEAYVVVTNAAGDTRSAASSATPIGKPSAPTNLRATQDSKIPGNFLFEWNPPADNGGSTIVAYEVEGYDGIRTIIGPRPPAMDFKLNSPIGEKLTIKVRAYNAQPGSGASGDRVSEWASQTITLQWPADPISAAAPVATGESGVITLTKPTPESLSYGWTAGNYTYQYRINGGSPQPMSSSTAKITGLQNGQPVRVEFQATASNGSATSQPGEWTLGGIAVPYGPAELPTITNCKSSSPGTITCQTGGGSLGGMDGAITYWARIPGADSNGRVDNSGKLQFSNLNPGETYEVCVFLHQKAASDNPQQNDVQLDDCMASVKVMNKPAPTPEPTPDPTPDPTPVGPQLLAPDISCQPGANAGEASCTWGGGDTNTTAVDWFLTYPGSSQYGDTVAASDSRTFTGLPSGSGEFCILAMDGPGNIEPNCVTLAVP